MATKHEIEMEKNGEVTSSGIKKRGDPIKGKHQIVTVNSTPVGKFKKRLLTGCFSVLALANAVGLALEWEPSMVHVAYPLAGVAILGLVLIAVTKME